MGLSFTTILGLVADSIDASGTLRAAVSFAVFIIGRTLDPKGEPFRLLIPFIP